MRFSYDNTDNRPVGFIEEKLKIQQVLEGEVAGGYGSGPTGKYLSICFQFGAK